MIFRWASAAIAAAFLATAANATIVFDQSPDVVGLTGGSVAVNNSGGQNFVVKFSLGRTTTIDGFDIYSSGGGFALGTATIVKLRRDIAGSPNTVNDYAFATTISAIDLDGSSTSASLRRLYADFTATTLAAGDYWIGMTGNPTNIGWDIDFDTPGAGAWQLQGDARLFRFGSNVSFAYRVHGEAVPEPAAWTLLIGGFAVVGTALRRRRAAGAALTGVAIA